ncbi:MAG: MATE family efflux transporter, partial [Gammaproteobacteria bacterium]|nr:MATE family efflux transporter [Gammaproteobacteria bacterium]
MFNYLTQPEIKNESREMLKLALPAVISQVAQMSMGAIDTIMAGNLSTKALAAISVGSNMLFPLLVFSMGLFMSLNPLVAQANGAQRFNKLGEYLRQGLYLALIATIPTILIVSQLETLMIMIGVQESIIPVVVNYLKALTWGILPLYLFLVLRSVNEGLFSTKAIMFITISAIPFNVFFNYVLMYGYFGFPELGAVGLGYATSIVWSLLFIVLLLYTLLTKKYAHLTFFTHFHKPDLKVFKEILQIGIPLSLTIGLEVLMFGAVGLFIGRYSVEIIAAHQIATNFSGLVFMVPLGLSIAVTARVGHAAGRKSPHDIKRAAYLGLLFAIIFMLIAMLVTISIPTRLVNIYSSELNVVNIAVKLFYMAALFMLCDGIQVAASGALRGMK